MALPNTGPISMSQVNVELGLSATALISLNDAAVRGLAEVSSGTISLQNLRGKANVFAFAIAANQTNANLRTLAVNAGWNQTAPVQATINSGVVISGNTQANSTAALTVDGSWPGGVTLTNNGTIVGRGGNGGQGGTVDGFFNTWTPRNNAFPGAAGGRAMLVSVAMTLQNNGTIAGGGGGGGGSGAASNYQDTDSGGVQNRIPGNGGGGGRSSNTNSSGGAGGTAGGSTSPGTTVPANGNSGAAGTFSAAGVGGAQIAITSVSPAGATGGGWGAAGGNGSAGLQGGNGVATSGAVGGAAGQAISGNGNITYTATGTRLGPIV
jgi:hypothetical protein